VSRTIICYLTVQNLIGSVKAAIPKVTGVWLLGYLECSRYFVFYSIIEYALANWLMRIETRIEAAAAKVAKEEATTSTAKGGAPAVGPEGVSVHEERSFKSVRKLSRAVSRALTMRNPPAIKKHLTGVDKLLVNSKGRMTVRDQHVDVFSRYAFPIAYVVVLAIFWGRQS
jgi:hypothetical protein